jgi:hypothetical protein
MGTKVLIDDNIRYPGGSKGRIYIEYPEMPFPNAHTPEALKLEFVLNNGEISGIPGVLIYEEKEDGTKIQELSLPPDTLYALFDHLKGVEEHE